MAGEIIITRAARPGKEGGITSLPATALPGNAGGRGGFRDSDDVAPA